ncbi:dTDP-4-dehydrorhamnose reductase [Alphaproteobacteria bacterium]|nr:dTDP-4-dehydrorhamnose reductase [Alphaproteobacteria bacterium]
MILVFGEKGQIAQELSQYDDIKCFGREVVDFLQPETLKKFIEIKKPTLVINAAAYTDVDKAENEKEAATIINGIAPAKIAQACEQFGIPLIHFSSDYVFSGKIGRPWKPDDKPEPVNTYGYSKLLGEQAIMSSSARAVIIRTSWVFSSFGNNFVKTIFKLSKKHGSIKVVDDQIGGPTSAHSLAKNSIKIARHMTHSSHPGGIYHLSGTANLSWYKFAKQIVKQIESKMVILPVRSSEYRLTALRPKNSCLDCSKITNDFGINRPDWSKDLQVVIDQLRATNQ